MTIARSAGMAINSAGLATLAFCLSLQGPAHAQAVGGADSAAPCQQDLIGKSIACGLLSTAGEANVFYGTAVGYQANATGSGATAVGVSTVATGDNSTAVGDSAVATGANNVALGVQAAAKSFFTTALGGGAQSLARYGTTAGFGATVSGSGALNGNVAIGYSSSDGGVTSRDVVSVGNDGSDGSTPFTRAITNVSDGVIAPGSTDAVTGAQLYSTNFTANSALNLASSAAAEASQAEEDAQAALAASGGGGGTPYLKVGGSGALPIVSGVGAVGLGVGQTATGNGAVAIGDPNTATGTGAVAIGANNTATGQGAVAIGNNSTAYGASAIALGDSANAALAGDVALGGGASVTASNAVAVGANSIAGRDNTVSVGSVGAERQITNVAPGSSGTDAVNVNQLNAASATTLAGANAYTNAQIASVRLDISQLRRDLRSGIAGSDAISGIPQNVVPGRTTMGFGVSEYGGSVGLALGISTTLRDGRTNARLYVSTSSNGGPAHISGGASWSF